MRWAEKLQLRVRSLLHRERIDHELDDELRFHLEQQMEENMVGGMSAEEARYAAQRTMGGLPQIKEECRDQRSLTLIEGSIRDIRYATRILRKSPAFTSVAVVSLAFGIGANTAIFSMVNGILLRALPYERPDELYVVRETVQLGPQASSDRPVNAGNFLLWRRNCTSFSGIAALEPTTDNLGLGNEAVQIHGARASANLFSILRVPPQVGRSFMPEEDQPGHNFVVMLTDSLWRAQFNSNPNIIGKTISLNGYGFVVVGVLPATFDFPKQDQLYGTPIAGWTAPIQYFTPLGLRPWETKPGIGSFNFAVIARVNRGVSRQRALADLDAAEAQIAKGDPSGASLHAQLLPMQAAVVEGAKGGLWMLMAGVGVLLLIVCVNLASLLLARNTTRAHEIAVRTALGASRWSLLRQFLTEGLLLAATGGALGVGVAFGGLNTLLRTAPVSLPRMESVHVDGRVLLFSTVISLVTGVLFSVLPSLRLSRAEPGDALKSAAPTVTGARRTARLQDLLAASEVALCTVLLTGALLLARSLGQVLRANAWLETQRVLAIDLVPPPKQYQSPLDHEHLYRRVVDAATELPGVQAAGLINALPLAGEMWTDEINFQEVSQSSPELSSANFRFTSPDYFRAVGLPLLAGRFFTHADEGRAVVIISEGIARKALAGRNPMGLHLRWSRPGDGKTMLYEVTGVVGDARALSDEEPPLTVYLPYWVWSPSEVSLVLRTAADPRGTAADVREMIRRIDKQIAIPHEETMQEVLANAVAQRRFLMWLGILFAVAATILAAIGLYGVISLSVSRRRHEIGIRMALGAHQRQVLRMVIVKGVKLTLAGVGAGVLCALTLTRSIASLLYGVQPTDAITYTAVCFVLGAVALLGSYIPARRAAQVDPMIALRYE